jgi:ribose transport system substrate-binding protein
MPLSSDGLMLWDPAQTHVPPRPDDPSRYPESDPRRWYDAEYLGWRVVKGALPASPGGGPRGRRLAVLLPFIHPYWTEYEQGLASEAERLGMTVQVFNAGWDHERQATIVQELVERRPDLVIFVPVEPFMASDCLRRLAGAGIPVIASNQSLEAEAYQAIISWTGPNDWAQHRLLARHFAELMGHEGGFCIISHKPGTSPYLARVWGLRTELGLVAPAMVCLDVRYTGLDRERSRLAVLNWLDRYGQRLKGLVSADDAAPMEGVKRALAERGRTDVVCVANGATRRGFEFVRDGTLKAVTWQSPAMDGMLAVRTAADWFTGIAVEAIRYLPACIVTAAEADSFLASRQALETPPGEQLCSIIAEGHLDQLHWFFDDLERRITGSHAMSVDYFRGLLIEMLAGLLNMARTNDVDGVALFGGYETLYRGLARREHPADALNWVRDVAIELLDRLVASGKLSASLVERLITFTELHYSDPLALKTIAERFGLSAAYLGKLFRERTGNSWSRYLNELRIRKAKVLLAAGEQRPRELARAVGYADAGYFLAVFRKLTGTSPGEYTGADQASGMVAGTPASGAAGAGTASWPTAGAGAPGVAGTPASGAVAGRTAGSGAGSGAGAPGVAGTPASGAVAGRTAGPGAGLRSGGTP